jgi:hypothetical protein
MCGLRRTAATAALPPIAPTRPDSLAAVELAIRIAVVKGANGCNGSGNAPVLRDLPPIVWKTITPTAIVTVRERAPQGTPPSRSPSSRGTWSCSVDIGLLLDIYAGAVFYRVLVSGEPITSLLAEQLVSLLIDGISRQTQQHPRERRQGNSRTPTTDAHPRTEHSPAGMKHPKISILRDPRHPTSRSGTPPPVGGAGAGRVGGLIDLAVLADAPGRPDNCDRPGLVRWGDQQVAGAGLARPGLTFGVVGHDSPMQHGVCTRAGPE